MYKISEWCWIQHCISIKEGKCLSVFRQKAFIKETGRILPPGSRGTGEWTGDLSLLDSVCLKGLTFVYLCLHSEVFYCKQGLRALVLCPQASTYFILPPRGIHHYYNYYYCSSSSSEVQRVLELYTHKYCYCKQMLLFECKKLDETKYRLNVLWENVSELQFGVFCWGGCLHTVPGKLTIQF